VVPYTTSVDVTAGGIKDWTRPLYEVLQYTSSLLKDPVIPFH
jgi:hypothetical protein